MYKISIILTLSLCFNFLFSEGNVAKDIHLSNIEDYDSIKPNYDAGQTEYNPNINPQSDSRDTPVEIYFCTIAGLMNPLSIYVVLVVVCGLLIIKLDGLEIIHAIPKICP